MGRLDGLTISSRKLATNYRRRKGSKSMLIEVAADDWSSVWSTWVALAPADTNETRKNWRNFSLTSLRLGSVEKLFSFPFLLAIYWEDERNLQLFKKKVVVSSFVELKWKVERQPSDKNRVKKKREIKKH